MLYVIVIRIILLDQIFLHYDKLKNSRLYNHEIFEKIQLAFGGILPPPHSYLICLMTCELLTHFYLNFLDAYFCLEMLLTLAVLG